MSLSGVLGATISVSTTAIANPLTVAAITDLNTGFTYTEIAQVENAGEFGQVFETVSFQNVKTGQKQKFKGGFDYGQMQLALGQDLSDAGQLALRGYATTQDQNTYAFKVTLSGGNASFDTIYFGAKVMSYKTVLTTVTNVVKATVSLEINTQIFIGAS